MENSAETIKPFIVSLLTRKASLPPGIDVDAFRYLDYGQVDSLALVKFIVEIEDRFSIEFSPEDTQSDEFRTVKGLIDLIADKMSAQ